MSERYEMELQHQLDSLRSQLSAVEKERDDYREWHADVKRLTRELDVAMHGEAGAAKQASLCDLIGPAQKQSAKLQSLTTQLEGLRDVWRDRAECVEEVGTRETITARKSHSRGLRRCAEELAALLTEGSPQEKKKE